MQNVTLKLTGKMLTISMDVTKRLGASKSGKTDLIASTHGFAQVPGLPANAAPITFSLNVFTPKA